MYDAIIIGAGMSGLAAGIRLAYYGKSVCLLEQHSTIGGLNSFYRLGGRDFDVGLHAVTNFTNSKSKRTPLSRVLRQLRFDWDEFSLRPQFGSVIAFPETRLRFNNDVQCLEAEIAKIFPDQIDNFRRLSMEVSDYDSLDFDRASESARTFVSSFITDPLLADMILCPLMYYSNAREHDMDVAQFQILFRSIFLEGLGRPWEGIRLILKTLVRKYRQVGGELRLRNAVRQLLVEGNAVTGVVLDNGDVLQARQVISSAGLHETMRMCNRPDEEKTPSFGEISVVEAISVLNCQPSSIGISDTTVFFCNRPEFRWAKPEGLLDSSSGVICSPNNFAYDDPLPEGLLRITCLANYARWKELDPQQYSIEKLRAYDAMNRSAAQCISEFRDHVVASDTFTPTTIERYTKHINGALYGAPEKRYDGDTGISNLKICGTDQGFVGIVGALVGGVGMANRILQAS